MILDTNALSAWWNESPSAAAVMAGAVRICVPVPALAEFRFGVLQFRLRVTMEAWIEHALSSIEILDVTAATTRSYAAIRLELKERGTPIPMNDLWIAAIATQHQLPILSRDAHFDAVEGLERISW